jgi:hypothetical protein
MSLLYRPLESITAADMQDLVGNAVRESLYIEYKAEIFDKRDKEKRLQFLGSVSAFANAAGGDLLIGVEAQNAVPIALPGLDPDVVDAELLRIKHVLGSAVQPFLIVQFHSVALPNGRTIIIVRVPQSWTAPHGVAENGHYLFFKRHAAGRDPMTLAELRNAFTLSGGAVERIRGFRDQRLSWLQDKQLQLLRTKTVAVLHLVPFSSVLGETTVELRRGPTFELMSIHKRQCGFIQQGNIRYNADGVLMQDTGAYAWYTQMFRDGALEHVQSLNYHAVGTPTLLDVWRLQVNLVNTVPRFLRFQQSLGIAPPIAIMLTLLNVEGLKLNRCPGGGMFQERPSDYSIDRNTVVLPDVVARETAEPVPKLLKPVFDAIWNAAGLERCEFYRDGTWIIDSSWLDEPSE